MSQKQKISNEIELMICIERSIPQSNDNLQKKISDECSLILNKYQTDLSYEQHELGSDMQELYKKISIYSQIAQNLLIEFKPSQKLGLALKTINNSFKQLFAFLKTYTLKRKHYSEERLKELQSKLQEQLPGLCNRCSNFIMSRNIQQTKVLIGVGQFNDPFNLYDLGGSDFINIRNKEQEDQYKLKYAEVWQNKKNIEEKFHLLQVQMDKRSYGYTFTIEEINKFENVVEGIMKQNTHSQKPICQTDQYFKAIVTKLVHKIYHKIQQYKDGDIYKDQGIQVEFKQYNKFSQELKEENDKILKRNRQLNKKLLLKDKQIVDLTTKINKIQDEKNKRNFEKNSNQLIIKNFISQHVDDENKIAAANYELKNALSKNNSQQKQIEALRLEISKLHESTQMKLTKYRAALNQKTQKVIKQKQKLDQKTEKPTEIIRNNSEANKKNTEPESRRYSIRQSQKRSPSEQYSIMKSLMKEKQRENSLSKQGKSDSKNMNLKGKTESQYQNIEDLSSQQTNLIAEVSRNQIKKLSEIREQNSLSVREIDEKLLQQKKEDAISLKLIQAKEYIDKKQEEQSISHRKLKKSMKSMKSIRKIKRKQSLKQQFKLQNTQTQKQVNENQQIKVKKQEQQFKKQVINNKETKTQSKPNVVRKSKLKKTAFKLGNQFSKDSEGNKTEDIIKRSQIPENQKSQNQKQKNIKKFHSMYNNKNIKNNEFKNSKMMEKLKNSNEISNMNKGKHKTVHESIQKKFAEVNQSCSVLPRLSMGGQNEKNIKKDAYAYLYKYYKNKLPTIKKQQDVNKLTDSLAKIEQGQQVYTLNLQEFEWKIQSYIENTLCWLTEPGIDKKQMDRSLYSNKSRRIHDKEGRYFPYQGQKYRLTTEERIREQDKIKKMARKMSKMFFNQQLAYLIEKSQSCHHLANSSSNKIPNCNSIDTASKFKPSQLDSPKKSADSFLKQTMTNFQINKVDKNSLNSLYSTISSLKDTKMNGEINIMNVYQIKYLKCINILLVKLHNKDQRLFQIIKKSIIYPYSYLTQHLLTSNDKILSSLSSFKTTQQRKTVTHVNSNNSFLLRQSILKLIIMHRKCVGKVKMVKPSTEQKKEQRQGESEGVHICVHLEELKKMLEGQMYEGQDHINMNFQYLEKQNILGYKDMKQLNRSKITKLMSQSYNIDICPWN